MENINDLIAGIIKEVSGISIDRTLYNEDILSEQIGITPFYLVYIFVSIQDYFQIKVSDEDIMVGKFRTVNKISDIVIKEKHLGYNS